MMKRCCPSMCGLIVAVILLSSCAGPEVATRCTEPQDTPAYHFLQAMEKLDAGELTEARAQLDRSIYCDDAYSPAYSGLALLSAMQAAQQTDMDRRQADTKKALTALDQAEKSDKTPSDRFLIHATAIRVVSMLREDGWLEQAEQHLSLSQELRLNDQQLLYYQVREAAPYFMGLSYFSVQDYVRAREMFRLVINGRPESRWQEKADATWKKADKIFRAMAGSTVGDMGRKIAPKDQVTRGELAALLATELKIDQLFAGQTALKAKAEQPNAPFTPADVLNYPFKEEVLMLMKWNVRGLNPLLDQGTRAQLFKPQLAVKRKELAVILEDVLIKITGDEKLAVQFLGQEKSPFPDINPDSPWYNAAMNVATRGLMETELSGEFRPDAPVDGAEAILAVRALKQRLPHR